MTTRAGDIRPAATAPNDLRPRIIWGAVMAAAAIGAVLVGGWVLAIGLVAVCAIIAREWTAMTVSEEPAPTILVAAPALLGIVLAASGSLAGAAAALAAGVIAVGFVLRSGWAAAGVAYSGALGVGLVLLRADPFLGLEAVLFIFAVVWASDVAAYFAGRAFGGPKLWPRVSPKKTWSGFIAGSIAGVAAGVIVAMIAGVRISAVLIVVALGLSVLSAAGDLFESAVKRRFGKKDSGTLIPGHGGVMDRVDGLLAATAGATLIGTVHAGWPLLASGVLIW